jgi:tetratricopeptide (TPR) repeat protein
VRTIRIFISSPGDVAEERDRARQVVEQLRRRYAGQFDLKAVLWEDLPLQADMSFQQGIDLMLSRDHGVDIAIFVLWSRLGSPLGPLIRKPDGSIYRSGTEREFDLIMQARRQSKDDRPKILLYARRDEPSFDERLRGKPTDEKNQLINQKKLVEVFVQEEFHDVASGTNVRAYHNFDHPVSFSQRLRVHLQEMLDSMAEGAVSSPVWDIEKQGSPFRGLEVFEFEHAPVFFGREDEVLEARRALQKKAQEGCSFLLISGASGSGKSSLARAGVLPAVVDYELDSAVAGWRYAICTPSQLEGDLCGGLARLLCSSPVLPELRVSEDSVRVLADGFATAPKATVDQSVRPALKRAAQGKAGAVRLLLLVDQLEEIFTDKRLTEEGRAQFVDTLEALARSGSVWVIATVRSDFYQHCQRLPGLMRAKEGAGQIDVLPPSTDSLRRLIEYPARLAGLNFEQKDGVSLSDRILTDATAHAELLPLVSYVLRELFERRAPTGIMTFAAYEQLGGVEGALAKRAESVFNSLPAVVQADLPAVLRALVSVSGDEEESVVRQRVPLASFPPDGPARILVDRFVTERFLITDRAADGTPTVALAHEALLRLWNRASQWIAENREFLRVRSRVVARMKEGSRLLENDPLLESARRHLAGMPFGFTREQSAFIEDSARLANQAHQHRERLRHQISAVLTVLFVLAVAAAAWASKKQREAQLQAKEAREAAAQNRLSSEVMAAVFSEMWRLPGRRPMGNGPPPGENFGWPGQNSPLEVDDPFEKHGPGSLMDDALQRVVDAQGDKSAKARVLALKGKGLLQTGDLPNAEIAQRKALQLRTNVFGVSNPEISESLSLLGEVLFYRTNYAEAERCYAQALALEDWKPWLSSPTILENSVYCFANLLHRQNRDAEAEAFFARLFARGGRDSQNAMLLRARGIFRAKCKHWPEAASDLSLAIEADPSQFGYRYLYAICLVQMERYAEFQQVAHRILEGINPDCDPTTARRNAKTCLLAAPLEKDLALVDRFADQGTNGMGPDRFLVKGWSDYRRANFADATNQINKALRFRAGFSLLPNDPDVRAPAYLLLAMAHYRLNSVEGAKTCLEQGKAIVRDMTQRFEIGVTDSDDRFWAETLTDSVLLREASNLIEPPAAAKQ